LPLKIIPGPDATLEYRFFGMARANVPVTRVTTTRDLGNGVLPSSETRNGFEIGDHVLLVGVR
jgi:hypothetical protein